MMEVKNARLLSAAEAKLLLTKKERQYSDWWWLQSPGKYHDIAASVSSAGSVNFSRGYVNDDDICVRPVLWINLENSDRKIGDTFFFGGREFKIISVELAFCMEDIGKCCFTNVWRAEDANDYETSDVQRFVNTWFVKSLIDEGLLK